MQKSVSIEKSQYLSKLITETAVLTARLEDGSSGYLPVDFRCAINSELGSYVTEASHRNTGSSASWKFSVYYGEPVYGAPYSRAATVTCGFNPEYNIWRRVDAEAAREGFLLSPAERMLCPVYVLLCEEEVTENIESGSWYLGHVSTRYCSQKLGVQTVPAGALSVNELQLEPGARCLFKVSTQALSSGLRVSIARRDDQFSGIVTFPSTNMKLAMLFGVSTFLDGVDPQFLQLVTRVYESQLASL